jgi:hypothetical protein
MSNFHYNLTEDQQRLIDMYVSQYNQTNSHVERMLDMLDEIRSNIQNVIVSNQSRSNRYQRFSRYSTNNVNRYINRLLSENRPNYQSIYYDYNTPINPSIYSNIPINSTFRNNDLATFFNNFLNSTVPVRPTAEQLQNASRTIRYGDIETPLSETCPISLERFETDEMVMQIIPCGHLFCQSQFQEWFENNVRCPVCRYDIRNYRPNTRTSNSNQNIPTPVQTTSPNVNTNNETQESSFSNINIVRNDETNEIDQVGFDITSSDLANDLISNITSRLFQSILNPSSSNNDRFVMDPSNNLIIFETLLRPNTNNSNRTQ